MKKTSIKQTLFNYNLAILIILVLLTALVFNLSVHRYFEEELNTQLSRVLEHTSHIALERGPEYFQPPRLPEMAQAPLPRNDNRDFYFMLERSLRESLTVLNAEYLLIANNLTPVITPEYNRGRYNERVSEEVMNILQSDIDGENFRIRLSCEENTFLVLGLCVSEKNDFGLGWIVVYADLSQVNKIQQAINKILLVILFVAGCFSVLVSSVLAKKLAKPFLAIGDKLNALTNRKYGTALEIEAEDELKQLVRQVNQMSEALKNYDEAQKTFFQNVSHEFKTPLMAIQGHAEALLNEVVEKKEASLVILSETERLNKMVEQLMYLSRLESLEESVEIKKVDLNVMLNSVAYRFELFANQNGINIDLQIPDDIIIEADEEKLSIAFENILSNSCRYAKKQILISFKILTSEFLARPSYMVCIEDDGPGFSPNETEKVFERFFRGRKGQTGLGLAIAKKIIEMHNAKICAENSCNGAIVKICLHKKIEE